jgi:hypothetical protein
MWFDANFFEINLIIYSIWTNWATGWTNEPVSHSLHRFTRRSGFLNYGYNLYGKATLASNINKLRLH